MIYYTSRTRIPFQIDEDDLDAVAMYGWHISSPGYPATHLGNRRCQRVAYLHSFLLGRAPAGLEWDHINRDKLDNRRSNLRAVTRVINTRNTGLRISNSSGVKGVCWYPRYGRWQVYICTEGRPTYLGRFDTLEAATAARQAAEARLWGANR